MSHEPTRSHLGEPDLELAGFQLWVHGREFPDAEDPDDGNWLRVTARCGGSGASVRASGAILMVTDLESFGDQCAAMLRGERGSASLEPLEPELRISLGTNGAGGPIRARVELTPDPLRQAHRFDFELDPGHLPEVVRRCAAVLRTYPIRGSATE